MVWWPWQVKQRGSTTSDVTVAYRDPHAFIQWKGTDVCMDFRCDCGSNEHIDAMFVYFVKCHKCGTVWEMPTYLFPRKNHAKEQR